MVGNVARRTVMNDKEFFNRFARERGAYKVHPDAEYERIFRASGILGEPRNSRVLDAGCGSGAFSGFLTGYGFKVTGMDISDELVGIAAGINKEAVFVAGDIFKAPFPDGSFDLIFCGAVLHHFPDRLSECAAEFKRLLRPGGKVYFFEPYRFCANSFLRYRVFSFNRTADERALDPARLRAELEKAGFKTFGWQKLKAVRILYPRSRSLPGRALSLFRSVVNHQIFPNIFFTGFAGK
jgi:SAM-dependent methyltransferase